MDKIDEKAIKDIIAYYDSKKEENSPEETTKEMEAKGEETVQSLVELIEDAHKKKEAEELKAEPEKSAESTPGPEKPEETTSVPEELQEIAENTEADKNEQKADDGEEKIKSEDEEVSNPEVSENTAETAEKETISEEKDLIVEEEKLKSESEMEKPDIELAIKPVYDLSELEEEEEEEYEVGKKQIAAAVVITALIAAMVVVFITVDFGVIGRYKQNAVTNITLIFARFGIDISRDETDVSGLKTAGKYKASSQNAVTIPMETAGKSKFAAYRGSLACAYTNYLSLIGSDGKIVWENTTTIVDPILRTAGNYILIAENCGKKLCLYNDSRLVFEADTEDNILTCNLSSNGDVVIVTEKQAYKGAVVVFNREGNQIFAWSSGSDDILSADISSASRRVAVALLNSDDKVKSTIQLFDMNETESKVQAIFEDTILFDIDFTGDTVNAFGDNCMAGLTIQGDLIYDKRFDGAEFVHYGIDEAGNKILLFDDTNIPLINIYAPNGSLKYQLTSDELPEYVDIFGKYIVYNSGRDIIYGKFGKRQLSKYIASMDIKDLLMLGENSFAIVYSNNIEIVGK